MSERGTCPSSCSLYDAGCYAGYGHLGSHWRAVEHRGLPWAEFLARVRALPHGQLWRHNVAGDLAGAGTTVDYVRLAELVDANRGRRGFTFTHKTLASDVVLAAAQLGFVINVSLDALALADAPHVKDIPATVLLPSDAPGSLRTPQGRHVVVCPAQMATEATCASCQLCSRANRKAVIGFRAHGQFAQHVPGIVQLRLSRDSVAEGMSVRTRSTSCEVTVSRDVATMTTVLPVPSKSKRFGHRSIPRSTSPRAEPEQGQLIQRIALAQKGDTKARDQVVQSVMGFIRQIANRYSRGRSELADVLVTDGVLGAMEAITRFEFRPVKFLTYASWYILSAIQRSVKGEVSMLSGMTHAENTVRSPRWQRQSDALFAIGLDRSDVFKEVRKRWREGGVMSADTAARLHQASGSAPRSLNAPVYIGTDEGQMQDNLAADIVLQDELCERFELARRISEEVREALDKAGPFRDVEKAIIDRRLMVQDEPESLDAIGRTVGLTRERVRQIESELLRRVRRFLVTSTSASAWRERESSQRPRSPKLATPAPAASPTQDQAAESRVEAALAAVSADATRTRVCESCTTLHPSSAVLGRFQRPGGAEVSCGQCAKHVNSGFIVLRLQSVMLPPSTMSEAVSAAPTTSAPLLISIPVDTSFGLATVTAPEKVRRFERCRDRLLRRMEAYANESA